MSQKSSHFFFFPSFSLFFFLFFFEVALDVRAARGDLRGGAVDDECGRGPRLDGVGRHGDIGGLADVWSMHEQAVRSENLSLREIEDLMACRSCSRSSIHRRGACHWADAGGAVRVRGSVGKRSASAIAVTDGATARDTTRKR